MENPSYVVLSQQMALQSQMSMIANNLANMNTPAYRDQKLVFQEMLGSKAANPGLRGEGARVSFVGMAGTLADTREGPLEATGNQLDFAIKGQGYFTVDTPDGPRYTRDGHFGLDSQGRLINRDGLAVLDQAGRPLTAPQNAKTIEVTASGTLNSDKGIMGNMQIVKFDNDAAMQPVGGNLYQTTAPTQRIDATTIVQQGMMEGSNVQPILETTKMLEVQRAYDAAAQIISAEHDRDTKAIETLAKA